ncbi:small integral membrane protein 24 [Phyllopteryx taeniolatus]|uniref:small integral membrane protein 24 n=1 Tax=Phyllopteryx taeniolatus TaxID=161469 RepID=UPI002AD2D8E8|nr:small integral membrane protein 24 [Phyllopteryx taeniolatus]
MFVAFVVLCALQSAARGSTHKGVRASPSGAVTLRPWLTGLTAVVVFLFVVFVFVILSRLFRKDREEEAREAFGCYDEAAEMRQDEAKQTSF